MRAASRRHCNYAPPSSSWFRSCPRRIPAAAVAALTPKGCGSHRCVVQELEGWPGAECSSHAVWSGLFASRQMAGRITEFPIVEFFWDEETRWIYLFLRDCLPCLAAGAMKDWQTVVK